MVRKFRKFGILVALLSAPAAGCAYAHEGPEAYGPGESGPEILAELPANAPPGECYAKVVVPGQPIAQPPVMQGAVWVMSLGQPGMPGPIWCLVPTGPVAQAPIQGPSRAGWIRVLCDTDQTPERIGHIQHALHERGYYRGEETGHYDRATAEAVTRFQGSAHINHGGYLSLETLQALDAQQTYAPSPQVAYYAGVYTQQTQAYYPQPLPPQAPCNCGPGGYAPPPGYSQQQVYGQSSYGYSAGYGGGYGFGTPTPAYAAAYASGGYASARASVRTTTTVQNGWLMWNGKSGY